MSFLNKRSSTTSCVPGIALPGLKPLHLVENLVSAKVISPIQPAQEPSSQIFRMLNMKKPRSSSQYVRNPPAAPHMSSVKRARPSVSRGPRPSLADKTNLAKRAPFVVPLHFSAPRASLPTPRPSTRKADVPRPVHSVKAKKVVPETISPMISRTSRRRTAPPSQHVKVASKSVKPKAATSKSTKEPVKEIPNGPTFRSRIPVFVSQCTPEMGMYTPAPTPRFSASRIPRLKYVGSPSFSSSSETTSVNSFNLQTPCPSPILVMDGRQMARSATRLDPAESPMTRGSDTSSELAESVKPTEMACFDALATSDSPSSTVIHPHPVVVEDSLDESLTQHTDSSFASDVSATASTPLPDTASSQGSPQEIATTFPQPEITVLATESRSMKETFLGELKTRLTMTKKATVSRSNAFSPFVMVNRLEGRRAGKESIAEASELQQAFARRRSGGTVIPDSPRSLIIKSNPETQHRSAIGSVPRAVNSARSSLGTGIRTNPSSPSAPQLPPPSPANCDLPGAECITELVTTAFGTRKVRRLVVPPVLEGSLPSRDPRIVMELNSLRAQQKVAGGGKGAAVAEL
ncbi:hypothetical protein B0H15DRAFT_417007 [Mycena belliarum]|uniref:Uncharacterized protein n=1 Tax=Mycena belliarum TaxID=1033014 RepID=A0AAD6U2M9_9AGAR|nr:hypothetical protein B0H15DRAFT_417007 [Mycena belliae]